MIEGQPQKEAAPIEVQAALRDFIDAINNIGQEVDIDIQQENFAYHININSDIDPDVVYKILATLKQNHPRVMVQIGNGAEIVLKLLKNNMH